MSRHILKVHSGEYEVAKIPSLPPKNTTLTESEINVIKRKREMGLDKLRNMGDFNNNVEVIANKKGTLIIGKRNKHFSPEDYLPCSQCYVFFLKKEIWRHMKKCKFRNSAVVFENKDLEKKAERQFQTTSRILMYGAGGHIWNESFNEHYIRFVINSLTNDDISRVIKSDPLLVDFGKVQFEKLGTQRAGEVRSKLRILGRVKLELRLLTGKENSNIEEYLTSKNFDVCVEAVKKLCIVPVSKRSLSGTEILEKPDLALKAGQLLKKVAVFKRGKALRAKDTSRKEDADNFIELYLGEWSDKLGGMARVTISERKYNRKVVIPLTEDLVKLSVRIFLLRFLTTLISTKR